MRYLILITLLASCAPKDHRVYACMKSDMNICTAFPWPHTKEACVGLLKDYFKKYPKAIFSCKKVES